MNALIICTTFTSEIIVVALSNVIRIKCCTLTRSWHLEMRASMLYSNVDWDHQWVISRRWWTTLTWCLSTNIIIIWSRWRKQECDIQWNCEDRFLINLFHTSLRLLFERFYLNTKDWLNISQSFLLALRFLSSWSNCFALTSFRNNCMIKNVCWLKTCIRTEDKYNDCWSLDYFLNVD